MASVTTPATAADAAVELLVAALRHGPEWVDIDALRALDSRVRARLVGDQRAERFLAEVLANPDNATWRGALVGELRYYCDVDPDFRADLSSIVSDCARDARHPSAALHRR